MAPESDPMTDLDRPATLRELQTEIHAAKEELRTEIQAAKEELRAELATKTELHAAKEELRAEMSTGFAEMRDYVDFSRKSLRDELRTHFDVIAESLRADFRNMFDWMKANMTSAAVRLDALETGHGGRLTSLETRVTRLEVDDQRKSQRSVKPKA